VPRLVVNGVWAVFSIWDVAQLTAIHGSVGLGFLPPQDCDYYAKAAAAANPESHDLPSHRDSIVPPPLQGAGLCCCLLLPSPSTADGLAPSLALSVALTSPAAAFPCSSSCRRFPLQPPSMLALPSQGITSLLALLTPGTPQRHHRCSTNTLINVP
jgi:hypothetical protein